MCHMSVVMYFLFIICLSVAAVVVAIIVVHLHFRAERKPAVAMSAWVRRARKILQISLLTQLHTADTGKTKLSCLVLSVSAV